MSDLGDLAGRTALVTGAASGIGAAVTRAFLARGVRVAALDVESIGQDDPAVVPLTCDVSSAGQVEKAVAEAAARLGRIDFLVNCAGILRDAVLWKLDDQQWREVIGVNLTGSFHLLRSVVPVMRGQGEGAVVLISSINGLRGKFGQANYSASKAGVIALARTAALETARFGIRINAIAPGMVRTPMTESLPPQVLEDAVREIPLGRMLEPEEIADAVLLLCSPLARAITGTVLRVDGGQLAG